MARVPASEFQREFGRLRGVAHREAVSVTSHGRDDVVLLSAEEYQRLRSLDRRAMHVSDLTDEELAALDNVERISGAVSRFVMIDEDILRQALLACPCDLAGDKPANVLPIFSL
jgi:prevent-host-death family protein